MHEIDKIVQSTKDFYDVCDIYFISQKFRLSHFKRIPPHCFPDIPSVKIFEDSSVCFGSETTIRSVISSTPPPEKIEWEKSMDEVNFSCIRYAKYPQSTDNSTCPSIVIKKTSFDDRLFYRLLVWNAIGESVSNTVYLNVTGSMSKFLKLFLDTYPEKIKICSIL